MGLLNIGLSLELLFDCTKGVNITVIVKNKSRSNCPDGGAYNVLETPA